MHALSTGMRPRFLNSVVCASSLNAQAISTSKPESPASRTAATRSARCTVPNSGPMKTAARVSVLP